MDPNSDGSGKKTKDESIVEALKNIDLKERFERLPKTPCMRESLMYGIAGGAGMGAVRFLSAGVRPATNWAVGSFVLISIMTWNICLSQYEKSNKTIKTIIERYPERNIRVAQKRAEERRAAEEAATKAAAEEEVKKAEAASKRRSWYRLW